MTDSRKTLGVVRRRFHVVLIVALFVILGLIDGLHMFAKLFDFEKVMLTSVFLLLLAMSVFLMHEVSQTVESGEQIAELERSIDAIHEKTAMELRAFQTATEALIRRMQPTFLSHSRRDLYLLGADIASQATTRVYLLARSLILLTGPRPYGLSPGVDYEESHQDALRAVLEKARGGRIRFACGYLIPTTREEIREYPQLRDTVKRRLIDLHDAAHGTHFSITTPGRWSQPFTFIVGDNRFAIWFRDPAQDVYICISSEDKTVATGLVNIFDNECKAKALEALLGELGI